LSRPQVGVEIKLTAKLNDRAAIAFDRIAGAADCAKEDCFAVFCEINSFLRECDSSSLKGLEPRLAPDKLNARDEVGEHTLRNRDDLLTDAIPQNAADPNHAPGNLPCCW
jgi:hypothetical protein